MDEAAIEPLASNPSNLLNDAKAVKDRASPEKAIFNLHQHQNLGPLQCPATKTSKPPARSLPTSPLAWDCLTAIITRTTTNPKIRTNMDHVAKMFVLAGWPEADAKKGADNVMKLETQIAKVSKTNVERRDPWGLYNRVERDGLVKLAPIHAGQILESSNTPVSRRSRHFDNIFRRHQHPVERQHRNQPQQNAQLWRDYLTWQVRRHGQYLAQNSSIKTSPC